MRKWMARAFIWPTAAATLVTISLAQNVKVGFVNTLEVLYATEEGKRELEQLNQFASGRQQELAARTSELQKLQEQYVAQQGTLNVEARLEMERDITEKERSLKRLQEDIELDYNQRSDVLLAKMSEKIREVINTYARENRYGVIFLRNEAQTYVDASLDITQEIIRIYNQRNPATGQASSGSTSSAQPPAQ